MGANLSSTSPMTKMIMDGSFLTASVKKLTIS